MKERRRSKKNKILVEGEDTIAHEIEVGETEVINGPESIIDSREALNRLHWLKENSTVQAKRAMNSVGSVAKVCWSSTLLPVVLAMFILLLLVVLFRMKRIELDYKYSEIKSQISHAMFENKELNAEKAHLTSVKSLNVIAQKHKLERPEERQIILIP